MRYERHDIGKIIGVLITGVALYRAMEGLLVALVGGATALDLGVVPAFVLGVALYRHRNWARVLVTVLAAVGLALCVGVSVLAAVTPDGQSVSLTIRKHTIENPSLWHVVVATGFCVGVLGLLIYFLNTEKAKVEFGVARRGAAPGEDAAT